MNLERTYTSTATKLLQNLSLLQAIQNGRFIPQSVQIAPTDKCNLNCNMCSVKNREGDELDALEIDKILKTFKDMGARTVEFTGGGDPTMHKDINVILDRACYLHYQVGLITNGVALSNVEDFILENLTWIRISLNSLDYVSELDINIPTGPTLGFSYVLTDLTTEERIEQITEYAKKYNASYVRIVPNCLNHEETKLLREKFQRFFVNRERFFFQQKPYSVYRPCYIGYLKPFVNADGFVYHCSANPLIERKFHKDFRICHYKDIKEAWKTPMPFSSSLCESGKCFFSEDNKLISDCLNDSVHKDFL